MPWQTIPGIIGKVYLPDPQGSGKKHPCSGCFRCQNCSTDRCHLCRAEKETVGRDRSCVLPKEALP